MPTKKSQKKSIDSSSSWKNIKQRGRKAVTQQAKRKRWLTFSKRSLIIALSLFVLATFTAGGYLLKNRVSTGPLKQLTQPLEAFDFETDGVLTEAWVRNVLNIPDQIGMLDLDIFALKQKIENIQQVQSAIVERIFPNTLKISISEREPILKVIVMGPKGKKEGLLISADGHIFKGHGYSKEKLRDLLYVEGIELHKTPTGYKPLKHIHAASQLLSIAKSQCPEVYKSWQRVSFEYLAQGPGVLGAFIKISTQDMGEIIFAPNDYEIQLKRLVTILNYVGEQNRKSFQRIDLSLDGQAAVQVAQGSRVSPNY